MYLIETAHLIEDGRFIGQFAPDLSEGETAITASGRTTTPFPRVDISTRRKALNTEKRINAWLFDNAIKEAMARKDDFNLSQLQCADPSNPTIADKNMAELYLFLRRTVVKM